MKAKIISMLFALCYAFGVSAQMPTDINLYSNRGITKVASNNYNIDIPVQYLAYKTGSVFINQTKSYIVVFLESPSGKQYNITADTNNPAFTSYKSYSYTTNDSYVFINLQAKESGTWRLKLVQSNAGSWYYYEGYKKIKDSNLEYLFTSSGELIIRGEGAMPDFYIGYKPAPWYSYANKIKKITIGDKVTYLGMSCFEGCSSLTNIVIPNSVKTLDWNCFRLCSSLTKITIPESVSSIGGHCFDRCRLLTDINLPENLKVLKKNCFRECASLTKISIPDSIASIEGSVFLGCKSLTKISIPDNVTSLADSLFYDCSSLTDIALPNSITSMCNACFEGCTALTNIDLPDSITSMGHACFEGCTALTNIDLPNTITSIGNSCFYGCESLTNINIPDGMTSLGYGFFMGCTSLAQIELPNSISSLDRNCFLGCRKLSNITLSGNILSLGESCFDGCSSLTDVILPNSLTHIGSYCFRNCKSLSNITLPDSITSLSTACFEGCTSLSSIDLPESILNLYHRCFSDCTSLESIIIPNGVTEIDSGCFHGCTGLKSVTLPDSITTFEICAFANCEKLESISIPNTVTFIANYAFQNCKSLKSLTIPNSVTEVGSYAFEGCSSIPSLVFPNSLTTIGKSAFRACKALKTLYIPRFVTTIGDNAFADIDSLTTITNLADSAVQGNNLFSNYSTTLYIKKKAEDSFRNSFAWKNFNIVVGYDLDIIKENISFIKDQTQQIEINVLPTDYKDGVIWSSSDETVAKVDANGHLIATGFGKAKIATSLFDGSLYDECDIWVGSTLGDISCDGEIDIQDATSIISLILSNQEGMNVLADMNNDNRISITDFVWLRNEILDLPIVDETSKSKGFGKSNYYDNLNNICLAYNGDNNMEVSFDNNDGIIACQMDVVVPKGTSFNNVYLTGRASNHDIIMKQRQDGSYRIIITSMENKQIEQGADAVLNIEMSSSNATCGEITVSNIIACDTNNVKHYLKPVTIYAQTPTSIGALATEHDSEYISTSGVATGTSSKGVVIKRTKDESGNISIIKTIKK